VRLLQTLVPHYQPSAFLLQTLCETEARSNHEREAAHDFRSRTTHGPSAGLTGSPRESLPQPRRSPWRRSSRPWRVSGAA